MQNSEAVLRQQHMQALLAKSSNKQRRHSLINLTWGRPTRELCGLLLSVARWAILARRRQLYWLLIVDCDCLFMPWCQWWRRFDSAHADLIPHDASCIDIGYCLIVAPALTVATLYLLSFPLSLINDRPNTIVASLVPVVRCRHHWHHPMPPPSSFQKRNIFVSSQSMAHCYSYSIILPETCSYKTPRQRLRYNGSVSNDTEIINVKSISSMIQQRISEPSG